MCTSPITITKKRPDGSFESRVVPCGKCDECRSKKHSDFAALATLEAKACTSMYFVTLTYNDKTVPISKVVLHHYDEGFETVFSGFVPDSKMRELCVKRMKAASSSFMQDGSPLKSVSVSAKGRTPYENESEFDLVTYTPSLRREDVRLFLKRCRVEWERKYGMKMDFRYVFFGEYGSRTYRPHYHGILYNITDSEVCFFRDRWESEFGFSDFKFIPQVNKDGSPARIKVANYVSKYISKDLDYPALECGLVEPPRRFCSRGFGVKSLTPKNIQSLKNFINAKT